MKITSETAQITADTIAAASKRRAKGSRLIVRDEEEGGLALIVNPKSMTWVFSYRPRGTDPANGKRWPNKTLTLGTPASMAAKEARHAAAAIKGKAYAGGDPHADMKAKRAAQAADRAATLSRLLEQYEAVLPRRPKLRGAGLRTADHVADELAHARAAIAAMDAADMPASAVDTGHLRKLLTAEAARPATARARFGAFSRFMDWAQEERVIPLNPCLAVGRSWRPKAPPSRSNYLTPEQLATLWKAADKLEPLYRDLVRFLIAIPCRRGEAAKLDWLHLDLGAKTWSQPGALTKNGEPHRLHLHPLALAVIDARREALAMEEAKGEETRAAQIVAAGAPRAGLVFPAPRSGKAIDTFTAIKSDIDAAADLTGWRWHDFRRSFASHLGGAGVPEPVLDACLNHRQSATRSGVLGVYQRAQRWPEQVSALTAWGQALSAAINGKKPQSNVVRMKKKAAP